MQARFDLLNNLLKDTFSDLSVTDTKAVEGIIRDTYGGSDGAALMRYEKAAAQARRAPGHLAEATYMDCVSKKALDMLTGRRNLDTAFEVIEAGASISVLTQDPQYTSSLAVKLDRQLEDTTLFVESLEDVIDSMSGRECLELATTLADETVNVIKTAAQVFMPEYAIVNSNKTGIANSLNGAIDAMRRYTNVAKGTMSENNRSIMSRVKPERPDNTLQTNDEGLKARLLATKQDNSNLVAQAIELGEQFTMQFSNIARFVLRNQVATIKAMLRAFTLYQFAMYMIVWLSDANRVTSAFGLMEPDSAVSLTGQLVGLLPVRTVTQVSPESSGVAQLIGLVRGQGLVAPTILYTAPLPAEFAANLVASAFGKSSQSLPGALVWFVGVWFVYLNILAASGLIVRSLVSEKVANGVSSAANTALNLGRDSLQVGLGVAGGVPGVNTVVSVINKLVTTLTPDGISSVPTSSDKLSDAAELVRQRRVRQAPISQLRGLPQSFGRSRSANNQRAFLANAPRAPRGELVRPAVFGSNERFQQIGDSLRRDLNIPTQSPSSLKNIDRRVRGVSPGRGASQRNGVIQPRGSFR